MSEVKTDIQTPVGRVKQRSSIFSSSGKVRCAFKSPVRTLEKQCAQPKSDDQPSPSVKDLCLEKSLIERNKNENISCAESNCYRVKRRKISTGKFKTPNKSLTDNKGSEENLNIEELTTQLQNLQEYQTKLTKEIERLKKEGHQESDLPKFIDIIHEYNQIKDTTQLVLGQLALNLRVTTTSLYRQFGLDIDN